MSPAIRCHRGRQRGAALAMAIVFMGLSMVIVTALLSYVVSDYHATHADWRKVQALYCAEAGIEKAVAVMAAAASTTTIPETALSTDLAGAEGSYEVTIANVPNDPIGAKKITSTGYVPSKANAQATRTVTTVFASSTFDFGSDAVRARLGVEYGSNTDMTVVVNSSYAVVTDTSIDASVRVTGTGASLGDVQSIAANKATVAGSVWAPGFVDIKPANARYISEGNPANYIPDAFPPPTVLGSWNPDGSLAWPPAAGTWAAQYYDQALQGGTSYASSGSFSGSKFIELYGTGELHSATLSGPGIVFVHGGMGGGVVNGAPPVTLVLSGSLNTQGNDVYRFNPGTSASPPPSLITFGLSSEIKGNSNWYLNGAMFSLNPSSEILINDSAIGCFGALISNGMIHFKSSKGTLGFPQSLKNKHFTAQGLPLVVSYAAR